MVLVVYGWLRLAAGGWLGGVWCVGALGVVVGAQIFFEKVLDFWCGVSDTGVMAESSRRGAVMGRPSECPACGKGVAVFRDRRSGLAAWYCGAHGRLWRGMHGVWRVARGEEQ